MTPDFDRKSVLRDHKLAQLEGHSGVGRWGDDGGMLEGGEAAKNVKKTNRIICFYIILCNLKK